jgi:hypothetical protein
LATKDETRTEVEDKSVGYVVLHKDKGRIEKIKPYSVTEETTAHTKRRILQMNT